MIIDSVVFIGNSNQDIENVLFDIVQSIPAGSTLKVATNSGSENQYQLFSNGSLVATATADSSAQQILAFIIDNGGFPSQPVGSTTSTGSNPQNLNQTGFLTNLNLPQWLNDIIAAIKNAVSKFIDSLLANFRQVISILVLIAIVAIITFLFSKAFKK